MRPLRFFLLKCYESFENLDETLLQTSDYITTVFHFPSNKALFNSYYYFG